MFTGAAAPGSAATPRAADLAVLSPPEKSALFCFLRDVPGNQAVVGIACVRTLQSATHGARWSSRPKTASSHIASSHLPATRPFPAAVSHFQPRQLRRMITLQKSTRLLKAPSWLRGWASASTSRLRPRRSTSCLATWLWPRVCAAGHDAAHTAPEAARSAPDQRRGALPNEQPRGISCCRRSVCGVRAALKPRSQSPQPRAAAAAREEAPKPARTLVKFTLLLLDFPEQRPF